MSTMAKKPTKQKTEPLSPSELAQYKPEDPLPKLQKEISLSLGTTFDMAVHAGAMVVGETRNQHELPKPL